jgi:hypothetical protein
MNVKKIDCTGFHFHCPDDRAYVIFNPQSQEENDRLDALFGATPLWKESLEKKRAKFQRLNQARIEPFTELYPVGITPSADETVAVVIAGAAAWLNDQFHSQGQWFAVRFTERTVVELKTDLRAELVRRKDALTTMSGDQTKSITEVEVE